VNIHKRFGGSHVQVILFPIFLVMGFVQLFAVMDGIEYAIGLGGILNFFLSLFIAYIPILGSLTGMYGAINVWDFSLWQAILLFFWMYPVFIVISAISRD
jgi:hypothetical protein